jgi:P-type Cu+ transporter
LTKAANTRGLCYHCGDLCPDKSNVFDQKSFCCSGCLGVYKLLYKNELCAYYNDQTFAGQTPISADKIKKFAFLDDPNAALELLKFSSADHAVVEWHLPQMHCASCVWLLEHLQKMDPGITQSRVHFIDRTLTVHFNPTQTNLRQIATLLSRIGYEPHLELSSHQTSTKTKSQRKQWLILGVTGFCFGNIMLLSLPEYLGLHMERDQHLAYLFRYLSLLISIPALLIGGRSFFQNALRSLRKKELHIDLGIALSLSLTFSRSTYEILSGFGSGYLDSMTGILFFMHIGRFFQNKTHERIHFDLHYKHFFPLHVQRMDAKGKTESISIQRIVKDDLLEITCQEIIPADSICLSDQSEIDYSFVTGESAPVQVQRNELIYAGGRNLSQAIHVKAIKSVDQSYLTQLWNKEKNETSKTEYSFGNQLGSYFTIALLIISFSAFMYWYPNDSARAWKAMTTVLIVACPCALLLSATFTQGTLLRHLASYQIFVKNAGPLDRIRNIEYVVLDKTGTITGYHEHSSFVGVPLSIEEKTLIGTLARQSNHPYSKALSRMMQPALLSGKTSHFRQEVGKGLSAFINGNYVKIGSAAFLGLPYKDAIAGSRVYIQINETHRGYFQFEHQFRHGLKATLATLSQNKELGLLSGDSASGQQGLTPLMPYLQMIQFQQTPQQKLETIRHLQLTKKVMMVGDGLNDAAALAQSDIGIAISDRSNHFSPACDVLIAGDSFHLLPQLFSVAKGSRHIIYASFALSLLYNMVGLFYATQGQMSPLIAAILMPLSSISIILFTHGASWILCKVNFKTDPSHIPS